MSKLCKLLDWMGVKSLKMYPTKTVIQVPNGWRMFLEIVGEFCVKDPPFQSLKDARLLSRSWVWFSHVLVGCNPSWCLMPIILLDLKMHGILSKSVKQNALLICSPCQYYLAWINHFVIKVCILSVEMVGG